MLSITGYALYKLLRTMSRRYREFKEDLVTAWLQLKKRFQLIGKIYLQPEKQNG